MMPRLRVVLCLSYAFFLLASLLLAHELLAHHDANNTESLPNIGTAPDFTLTTQDNASLSLTDLRGKVIAVSFMFTRCADVCPLLTVKLVDIQNKLGQPFGREVFFISITVDPETDRPDILKRYAEAFGYKPEGWAFLTGTPEQIMQTVRQYGIFHEKDSSGNVDHNLLTSIIDRRGILRVQYMGDRFDPNEFLHDLYSLMSEGTM